jgi:hypothetical protein
MQYMCLYVHVLLMYVYVLHVFSHNLGKEKCKSHQYMQYMPINQQYVE